MFARKIYLPLDKALEENNIVAPINFQKQCFSHIKSGEDLICHAETGCGKTTMLAIGTVQKLQKALNDVPRALVFVPVPEAAEACFDVFTKVARHTDLRIFNLHVSGNQDDLKNLIYMGSDIIIGTANRIGELYTENILNLSDLRIFAIDDAELHTRQDINSQLERMSDSVKKAQFLIFTGKLTDRIIRFSERFMRTSEVVS